VRHDGHPRRAYDRSDVGERDRAQQQRATVTVNERRQIGVGWRVVEFENRQVERRSRMLVVKLPCGVGSEQVDVVARPECIDECGGVVERVRGARRVGTQPGESHAVGVIDVFTVVL
jgi:hypothetical protein